MRNINKAQKWIQDNEELLIDMLALMPEVTHALAWRIVDKACKQRIHMKRYWSKTVVGYTQNGKMYYNIRNNKSLEKCVDFIIHECCHLCGMKHDAIKWYKGNRKQVEQSLVYRIGYKAAEVYRSEK